MSITKARAFTRAVRCGLMLLVAGLALLVPHATAAPRTPNILFIVMDDVGIDQLDTFGYGGATPPATPNIDALARGGVRFHNAWSMPACSTSRSVFFDGRYPFRTNVFGALGPYDLANSMVSPYETTVPKLLKVRGYHSALFGKFHLGLQGKNPDKDAMPRSLGWDYFFGWLDETGDPSSIDTTAGGVAMAGRWSCGFVGTSKPGGADSGACYFSDDTCRPMSSNAVPPGRICRDAGGIFDPGKSCRSMRPPYVDFSLYSAHYVSPLTINREDGSVENLPPTDRRARTYRGTVVVDAAIDWINARPKDTPWMASVSFATVHTPIMQPPLALIPADSADTNAYDCDNTKLQRVLSNQMIEALDKELGRLLVRIGLAEYDHRGRLQYKPDKTDTMIVLVGDNGTLGFTVKLPFDSSRAKGTAYQTGVWVPLLVAGPLVRKVDRQVAAMVNIADLFALFGEIADIDVRKAVPRAIDAEPMLPYLTDPKQKPIRKLNFTQVGPNIQVGGTLNGPCTFVSSCSQIPVTKGVCEDNGGTWWGMGATASITAGIPADGLPYCCSVNVWLKNNPPATGTATVYSIEPLDSTAIRNENFKYVTNFTQTYDAASNTCVTNPPTTEELYLIDEDVPIPRIDRAGQDLLQKQALTPRERKNYEELKQALAALLATQVPCLGDGNIDGVVNGQDLADYNAMKALSQGNSSWYDLDRNGYTNPDDLSIIQANLGVKCAK